LSIIEKTVNQSGSPSLQRWTCIHLEDVRDRFEPLNCLILCKIPVIDYIYTNTTPILGHVFVKELSSSIKIAMPK